MSKNTPEQQAVLDSFFGWDELWGYRTPLPPTDQFPEMLRTRIGNINGVTELWHPPYIASFKHRGGVEVSLYEGDGYRVGYDPDRSGDNHAFIYADSEDMPEEWKEPVRLALEEVKARYPDKRIVYGRDADE